MTVEEAARAAAEEINSFTDSTVKRAYVDSDAAIILRHMREYESSLQRAVVVK